MIPSGIIFSDSATETYQKNLKLGRNNKYLVLEIKDNVIEIKQKWSLDAAEKDFVKALEATNDFCYGVFSRNKKIAPLIYGPSTANFKKRMNYASSSELLNKVLYFTDNALDIVDYGCCPERNVFQSRTLSADILAFAHCSCFGSSSRCLGLQSGR